MDLPPPGPNALELAFRRLLLKCEEQARSGRVGAEVAAAAAAAAGNGGGAAAAAGRPAGSAGKGGREQPLIGSGVLLDWRVDPKFHCYIDVLREQLQALEGSAAPPDAMPPPGARTPPLPPGAPPPAPPPAAAAAAAAAAAQDRPPPDVLALYRARVRALSEALRPPDVPAFCVGRASALAGSAIVALRAQEAAAAAAAAAAGGAAAAAAGPEGEAGPGSAASMLLQRPGGGPAARRQAQAKAAGAGGGGGGGAAGAAAAAARDGKGGGGQPQQQQQQQQQQPQLQLSKDAAARLATQQALQDGLAEELLGMTAELKAGALAMQGALRQRGRLVDEAEVGLEASAVGARAAARRAGEQYRRSRAGFCQTCLVMVCVACVFAGMIVWIKLTSMVGLSGRRRRGWLW